MALNITSDEAHRLARELAEATGSSMTEAVTYALRRTLTEVRGEVHPDLLLAEVTEIQSFVAGLPDREARDCRSSDELPGYDTDGLRR